MATWSGTAGLIKMEEDEDRCEAKLTWEEEMEQQFVNEVKEEDKNKDEKKDYGKENADDTKDPFIWIKSEGDGIFEDDNDFEDDNGSELQYFQEPEVEMRCPEEPVLGGRKRKQDLYAAKEDLVEIEEVNDSKDETNYEDLNYEFDDPLKLTFESKYRIGKRLPLYLLNPNDFQHDRQKQMQIHRAITTYRHHQSKNEQIIKLTEEAHNLRIHNQALREKIRELSRCGCNINQVANLDILDVVIPVVPPRMNIRMNRESLAVPFNNPCPKPVRLSTVGPRAPLNMLPGWTLTESASAALIPTSIPPAVNDKPFINIKSSYHLGQLNFKTPTNDYVSNIATHRLTSLRRISTTNGIPALSTPPFQRTLQPGTFGTTITGATSSDYPGRFTPLSELNTNTTTSSAKVVPPSRIVFAKRGSSYKTIQTINQLSLPKKYITPEVRMPLTASQLVFANNRAAGERKNFYATPSGQLLPRIKRNEESMTFVPRKIPGSVPKTFDPGVSKGRITVPRLAYSPLVHHLGPETTRRQMNGKQEKEMWNQMRMYGNNGDYHSTDEDEEAIFAAINEQTPPSSPEMRDRNQAIIGNLTKSHGLAVDDLELDKYRHIVFEEAN